MPISTSKNKASDERITVTDQGQVARGKSSKIQNQGAVDFGTKNKLNTGYDLGNANIKGNLSITVNEGTADLASDLTGALKTFAENTSTALKDTAAKLTGQSTPGVEKEKGKFSLIVLAALAVAVWFFYKRR